MEKWIEAALLNYWGWVLQELLLSPRTLHLRRNQIFYACRKLEACDTFPGGLLSIILNGTVKRISDKILSPAHYYEDTIFAWAQTIEHYTQRKLTNNKDKLVAVSAPAKEIGAILNDEYLAGIRRKTLPWGLLWSVFMYDVLDAVRSPKYRAPSWS